MSIELLHFDDNYYNIYFNNDAELTKNAYRDG